MFVKITIYVHYFITSFVFTEIVETSVVLLWLRLVSKIKEEKISTPKIVFASLFASFATLPYVWFVFPYLINNLGSVVWYSEPFAFVVEAVFYRTYLKVSWKTAISVSFIANSASLFLGRFLRLHNIWFYW